MACNSIQLANIARDCEANVGGIKKVWLTNYADNMFQLDASGSSITGVTSGKTWYTYEFRKGTGSLTSNLNVDEAAGTNFIQSDLVLQFSRMETAKRTAIAALSLGEVCGIVLDCNGKYWALGFDEPMTTSSGVGQTGTARTDSNNYSITLTDFAKTYPYEVAQSVVDGLQIGD